jgi:transcriptional regulator
MMEAKARQQVHPDWRDPHSYGHTGNLTRRDWAWEFLCRNRLDAKADHTLRVRAIQSRRLTQRINVIDTIHTGQAASWEFLRGGRSPRLCCLTCEFRRAAPVFGRRRTSASGLTAHFGAKLPKESIGEWLQHWGTDLRVLG